MEIFLRPHDLDHRAGRHAHGLGRPNRRAGLDGRNARADREEKSDEIHFVILAKAVREHEKTRAIISGRNF